MGMYNFLPEFMDNQETSGLWILTKGQLISVGGIGIVIFLIASLFTDSIIILLAVSLLLGGIGGFFMGMKYNGIIGYLLLWGMVTFFVRRYVFHSTVYYPSTFPIASSSERQNDISEVVDANSSLPNSL